MKYSFATESDYVYKFLTVFEKYCDKPFNTDLILSSKLDTDINELNISCWSPFWGKVPRKARQA